MSTNDPAETTSREVSLSDEDAVTRILVNSVHSLWDVVNDLTRLKPTRRDRYKVTIFGSARSQAGTFGYEETNGLPRHWPRWGATSSPAAALG